MSGSAANSAALRRRSGNQGTPPTQNVTSKNEQVRHQTPHPMQILENHELRLREIEKFVNEHSVNEHSVNEPFENNINELKLLVGKLQIFAIETSTSMMKLQAKNDVLEELLNKMIMSNADENDDDNADDNADENNVET